MHVDRIVGIGVHVFPILFLGLMSIYIEREKNGGGEMDCKSEISIYV